MQSFQDQVTQTDDLRTAQEAKSVADQQKEAADKRQDLKDESIRLK